MTNLCAMHGSRLTRWSTSPPSPTISTKLCIPRRYSLIFFVGDGQTLMVRYCPYEDVRCAMHIIKEIDKLPFNFTILVVGKMGTGKTTLVCGLSSSEPEEAFAFSHSQTRTVTPYKLEYDRVNFTIYDTPGLMDAINGSNDQMYLEEMQIPDLLLFTIKMNDPTLQQEDLNAIRKVSHAFGWKVWDRAIYVSPNFC